MSKKSTLLIVLLAITFPVFSESGYKLWLRYEPIKDESLAKNYRQQLKNILVEGNSTTLKIVGEELKTGLNGLLGTPISAVTSIGSLSGVVVCGTYDSPIVRELGIKPNEPLHGEGYLIKTIVYKGKKVTLITSKSDIGVLYGAHHFLRLLQTHQAIATLDIAQAPKIDLRLLNHWDNLDRTVERGYAGFSIWNWHKLPEFIDQRYVDYARANASIGINGTVLTNVNANALILSPHYLEKVKALADVFRPYGIKVYLTARFSAPIESGDLKTADPLDEQVQQWWNNKSKEIYDLIPDFGGFLVKANSEGQPGPQNYGRTHKDGANMLADAVAPYHGIVMWRAFVYDDKVPDDRAKQAYTEFKPFDGEFRKNVMVQVKNGAIDFQPREPFHPLFGTMPNTPLMMEFQITQEYLGFSTHLVYLPKFYKEVLAADTYANGIGTTVGKVIDGSADGLSLTGIAGVANIGTDINWTGHPFGQANWYGYGRLAWDHNLSEGDIAEEWIRMTFSNAADFLAPVKRIMLASHEATVNYMTPLGLHHIMDWSHHYGPGPWIKDKHRDDWTSVYYHRADSLGIGFDRTASGSNALFQYHKEVADQWSSIDDCPEELLLWFHHVGWDYRMKSGKTLWEEICHRYYAGADTVKWMKDTWAKMEGKIDQERYQEIKMLLDIQHKEAIWWRNACLLYFQTFSKRHIPDGLEKPSHDLAYYKSLSFPFAPGIRPQW